MANDPSRRSRGENRHSSSSSSSSSSTAASWYCWYSAMRSLRLDSASVNSISSMPSPVYQWRNALRVHGRELVRQALPQLLHDSGVAREGRGHLESLGGMSQMEVLQLFGIHSTKKAEFCRAWPRSRGRSPSTRACRGSSRSTRGTCRGAGRPRRHVLRVEVC